MYKINDKVTFLDETGIYTLIELLPNNEIKVEDEHGFDRICREKDIVLFESSTFNGIEIETFENRDVRVNPFAKKRKREKNIPTINLHIENLLDSHGHMANHEIVLFQIDYCRKQIDKHMERGTTQLLIIHGVGKGRLKDEVQYLLNSYPNIEYMDESYSNMSLGATKVYLK